MQTNPTDSNFVIVGKVGAPYGVRGWVKIQSFTDPLENILHYQPWFFAEKGQNWKEVTTESRQVHGLSLMAKFQDVDSPEAARLLTGKLIAVSREQLPILQKDEYYWSDLQGLTVINKEGKTLGTVTSLIETGANDVLIVKGEKEFAVPYMPGRYILSVDLEKREIHVDWEPI